MTRLVGDGLLKLTEPSKEIRLAAALDDLRVLLEALDEPWALFGSCGAFAAVGCAYRVTGDVDIVLEGTRGKGLLGIEQALSASSWECERRSGFLEARRPGMKAHFVEPDFVLVAGGREVGTVALGGALQGRRSSTFRLVCAGVSCRMPMLPSGILAILLLLAPPNPNTALDLCQLAKTRETWREHTGEFLAENGAVAGLLALRAEAYAEHLQELAVLMGEPFEEGVYGLATLLGILRSAA